MPRTGEQLQPKNQYQHSHVRLKSCVDQGRLGEYKTGIGSVVVPICTTYSDNTSGIVAKTILLEVTSSVQDKEELVKEMVQNQD